LRIAQRIAENLAGRQQQGNAGGGLPTELLAEPVEGLAIGSGQKVGHLVFYQAGPGGEVGSRFLDVKIAERAGKVPGEPKKDHCQDRQVGGKELPEKALRSHAQSLNR
jgi:hypothetical protein